jgi:hypothetical protein
MRQDMDDPRIDSAINTYPMVELPEGFIAETMTRVENHRTSIRFRLHFIDLAMPVFLAVFLLVLIGIGMWGAEQIDPLWLRNMQLEIASLKIVVSPSISVIAQLTVVTSGFFLLIGSLMVIWVVSRPRSNVRKIELPL